jgi:hypothetical protein
MISYTHTILIVVYVIESAYVLMYMVNIGDGLSSYIQATGLWSNMVIGQ